MKTWTIFKREVASFAVSPLTSVVGALFLAASGYVFSLTLIRTSRVDFLPVLFRYQANLLLVLVPLLTMRLLAGEKETGSVALLFTSPVGEWAIVLGKFTAALVVVLSYLACTLVFVAILFSLGAPDPGPVATGYQNGKASMMEPWA